MCINYANEQLSGLQRARGQRANCDIRCPCLLPRLLTKSRRSLSETIARDHNISGRSLFGALISLQTKHSFWTGDIQILQMTSRTVMDARIRIHFGRHLGLFYYFWQKHYLYMYTLLFNRIIKYLAFVSQYNRDVQTRQTQSWLMF